MEFKVVLEKDEDGWYTVTVPALPGCISQGKTEQEAKKNIQEAIRLHISMLAEDGIPIRHDKNIKETTVAVAI
ncbi:MAG TPA: type II toxin-antitoxin system HicB family antitoxin [archaeon]|nr:type II toxin-antitoxin system HicB family antitoxin [archaeon]